MSGSRFKILHVVFSLDPGGMENGIVNVARGLDSSAFEIHVCCLNNGGAFVERLPQPENVHILGRKTGLDFKAVVGLFRVITKINPDVIHTHNLGPLTYVSLATLFGLRRPVLHGEHGLLPEDQCTSKRVLQRKLLYHSCRKVHTVSTGQKSQLAEVGLPAENIIAIINGVDTCRFVPAEKTAVRRHLNLFPENSQVLGIVGRFVALKRHMDLLEAFDGVAAKNENARLLVIGAGGNETQRIIERVNASPFRNRIHLSGFQSDPRPFYQAMDLLVVPSVIEGMSNVVLEAMACGVPVLAHQACGNSEMLTNGHNGMLANLSTVEDLRHEIEVSLADSFKLAEIGKRARQEVVENFSIARMVADYAKVYREIAGSKVEILETQPSSRSPHG